MTTDFSAPIDTALWVLCRLVCCVMLCCVSNTQNVLQQAVGCRRRRTTLYLYAEC